MEMISSLPEECLSLIISFTSPRDACRSSVLSPVFKSAADSDAVWDKFLPSDHLQIILTASSSPSSTLFLGSLTKKQLYFHICHNPIFIANGTMSFTIDKESGKKCYTIGARGLSIIWGNDARYWKWLSLPESSFPQVVKLDIVWWLDVKGKIETKILSPETTYGVYFLFKFVDDDRRFPQGGFRHNPVELFVHFEGSADRNVRRVLLDPPAHGLRMSRDREDGWMEIEMGEFFNDNGGDETLVFGLADVNTMYSKSGLIIEGIELRPIHRG